MLDEHDEHAAVPASGPIWWCVRQRAGPLVKECRALRPRLSADDTREDRLAKQQILRYGHTSVCRTQADRLELRLALFAFGGTHYTLTFDDEHLPRDFKGVRRVLRAFLARVKRWRHDRPTDYIYAIEGKHGDHRWHIHIIFHYADLSPAEVLHLWRQGMVDDEPVLRAQGGYRRLAEYLTKERDDGYLIPLGRHPWSCSRSLSAKLPPPERWRDESGIINIPDNTMWVRQRNIYNDFGSYYYGSYILDKKDYRQSLKLEEVARARVNT